MDKLTAWIKSGRGRLAQLATACGITHAAVWQWKQVPAERVLTVERVTGIPKEELRPDIFSPESAA